MDIRSRLSKVNWYAGLPLMLAHESLHYAAARLFHIPVKLHSYYVTIYPDDPAGWRVVVVTLAPALVGVCFLMAQLAIAFALRGWVLVPLALLTAIDWQGTCLSDWYCVYHFLRRREWPAEVWETPTKPMTVGEWLRQRIAERRATNGE